MALWATSGGQEIRGWPGAVLGAALLVVSIAVTIVAVRQQVRRMLGASWAMHALVIALAGSLCRMLAPRSFVYVSTG